MSNHSVLSSIPLPVLPQDTQGALDTMIALTQDMISETEQQTNHVALGHNLEFYNSVKTMDDLLPRYQQAVKEFKSREKEFLARQSTALQTIRQLTLHLERQTHINMGFLDSIRHKPGKAGQNS